MIDNYDSFTFNIVQYLAMLGAPVLVRRNDEITLDEIDRLRPSSILISPGPCTPAEAGISVSAIRRFGGKIPILGICLGHQCISVAFGGVVRRADAIFHGKVSQLKHNGRGLFAGVPQHLEVGRYHSLVVDNLPNDLIVTAREWRANDQKGEIMALEHIEFPIWGLQFHPESVLTEHGLRFFRNYLALIGHDESELHAKWDFSLPSFDRALAKSI
jgi:anthranilate synthase/aminodeoxychorismate synthase-like glutamine amidotransferase